MRRRTWLLGCGASIIAGGPLCEAAAKTPESSELKAIDLRLAGDAKLARRALVLVPTASRRNAAHHHMLILLHGLGETGNELLGIHAWGERYGLVRAYERLRQPPVARENPKLGYLSDERAGELNASLERDAFEGLVLVCPVTPNPYRGNAAAILEGYAEWVETALLPEAMQAAGLSGKRVRVGLDGCSLGGYVGLELMLRRPHLFDSFGVVQPAIGRANAAAYAKRLALAIQRVGPRPLHIETSSGDPYRAPSKLLADELTKLSVPNQFRISDGPHDQPWLREVGTLEMLLWHERQLNHGAA